MGRALRAALRSMPKKKIPRRPISALRRRSACPPTTIPTISWASGRPMPVRCRPGTRASAPWSISFARARWPAARFWLFSLRAAIRWASTCKSGPPTRVYTTSTFKSPGCCAFPTGWALARSQALAVPADLPATLAEWLELPAGAMGPLSHSLLPLAGWQPHRRRECVILRGAGDDWAVRSPAWHLLASGPASRRRIELYAKPSDRFEVNDIADRAGRRGRTGRTACTGPGSS